MIVRKDRVINLCEMKYSWEKYLVTKADDEAIRRKESDLLSVAGARYAIQPILITPYGIMDGSYTGYVQNGITTGDLFL